MNEARLTGQYRKKPWGYAAMGVRIYRAKSDGSLYAMRSAKGVIATAATTDALAELARANDWVASYYAEALNRWVTIPD